MTKSAYILLLHSNVGDCGEVGLASKNIDENISLIVSLQRNEASSGQYTSSLDTSLRNLALPSLVTRTWIHTRPRSTQSLNHFLTPPTTLTSRARCIFTTREMNEKAIKHMDTTMAPKVVVKVGGCVLKAQAAWLVGTIVYRTHMFSGWDSAGSELTLCGFPQSETCSVLQEKLPVG